MENTLMPAILMSALSLACLIILLAGLRKALAFSGVQPQTQRRTFNVTIIVMIIWILALGVLSINGVFSNFTMPPRVPMVVFLGFFITLLITFSKGFTRILQTTPPQWLVYFQSFRVLVEILLWFAWMKGLIPVQMTFEGFNYDVLSGILALPVGWMLAKRMKHARPIAIAYNILGLLLLFNILTIAILSMPTPFRQFTSEPANVIVAEFPFIYLPGVLVILAFAFHAFSLRQLLVKKSLVNSQWEGSSS